MNKFEKDLEQIYYDVFYFVVSRIHDEEKAKDITHDVMESVCKSIRTLRKKDAFKAWVMQIAKNKINDYYRELSKIRKKYNEYESKTIEDVNVEDIDIEDIKADILQSLVHQEDMINIMIALDKLEKKYQDVIRLNIICEYNLIETAELMGQNVNTVRTWSARGLLKLRDEFEKIETGGLK